MGEIVGYIKVSRFEPRFLASGFDTLYLMKGIVIGASLSGKLQLPDTCVQTQVFQYQRWMRS